MRRSAKESLVLSGVNQLQQSGFEEAVAGVAMQDDGQAAFLSASAFQGDQMKYTPRKTPR